MRPIWFNVLFTRVSYRLKACAVHTSRVRLTPDRQPEANRGMCNKRYAFTAPTTSMFRWLTDPGKSISPKVGVILLGELFASPKAVIAGVLNGLVLNVIALCMHSGPIFALFILLDMMLAAARVSVVRLAFNAASRGAKTPTDLYLATATSWCALQGAMAFAAMQTSLLPLQLLAATTVMGLIGPICARNYAAPRYALMLCALCDIPFVIGAALANNRWLLVLVLQTPLFLYGVLMIIKRFQAMAAATIQAEQDSRYSAQHDCLTGLLNRFGLMEMLKEFPATGSNDFVIFYLDLDEFKPINDTFGHEVGDKILQATAARLKSAVRDGDIISRLGGDEFVIVARDLAATAGMGYAERILQEVGRGPHTLDPIGPLHIGISIGFACSPEDGVVEAELHRKADLALYEAKAAGKGVYRRFETQPRSLSAGAMVRNVAPSAVPDPVA